MDEPIRVLHVLDKIDYGSGVSSVVMNYFNYMNCSKIIFDFAVSNAIPEELKLQIKKCGSRILRLPDLKVKNLFCYYNMLDCFFARYHKRYSVIHAHMPNLAFFPFFIAKKYNISVRILHCHNSSGADTFAKRIRNYLFSRISIYYATKYISCSNAATRYLFGKQRYVQKNVYLLKNAICLDMFQYNSEIRTKIRMENQIEDSFVIGHIGRFSPQKNHMFLLDIFAEVYKKIPNSVLILIGSGELEEELQKKVEKNNLEHAVKFLGNQKQINTYLQAMDLFLFPSLFEGLPVVCVEAQASGLPCLISDTVTPEIKVLNQTEFLDIHGSKELWVSRVTEIKKEYGDYEKRRSEAAKHMGKHGFDIRFACKKLERYYTDWVKNARDKAKTSANK